MSQTKVPASVARNVWIIVLSNLKMMNIDGRNERQIKVLKNVALISDVFALLLCMLIIINYAQWKKSDPLNSKALITLQERLNQNPEDTQLREEIRQLDLVARKAYFTSTWQIRTGGILLFVSLLIIITCYQAINLIRKKIPLKPVTSRDEIFFAKSKKRNAIMISGGVIIVFSMILAFIGSSSSSSVQTRHASSPRHASSQTQSSSQGQLSSQGDSSSQQTSSTSASPDSISPSSTFPTLAELRANWPAFRGPGGIGISYNGKFPINWDGKSGKNILWKTKIPLPGYNSPVYWKGKIYLAGANEKKREVYCIDVTTGKIQWTASSDKIPGSPGQAPKVNRETGYCAPTVTTDGQRIYAIFANGDLLALDTTGKQIWAKNMGMPKNHYGHSSSLITWHDLLIVQFDQSGNAFVAALNSKTGDQVWRTQRNVKVSWSSPILISVNKKTQLVLTAEPFLAGYDPASGKELWKLDCISGEVGPSPAFANGIVFSVNEYSKLAAVKLGDTPQQLWEDSEYLSDVPSPVATDKYLFLSTSYGTLVCYDALTGEKYWTQETGNNMYASPVLADGKIYQLDQKGVMHIFPADKVFKTIASPGLGEGSFCTPAFVAGKIFIRGDQHLFCIGK